MTTLCSTKILRTLVNNNTQKLNIVSVRPYPCPGTQHANRIFSAPLILLPVACLAIRNFSKLSHKRHDFRTKKFWIQTVFWLPAQLMSEIFLILRKKQRGIMTTYFTLSIRYSRQTLREIWFFRQIFEKSSNIKCHANPSSGNRVFSWGRTDKHDKTKQLFCANAPKNWGRMRKK